MQIRHETSVLGINGAMSKIHAMTWSPNGKRLAVANSERAILLFDENGENKDSFNTKPAPNGAKNYAIKGLAFSPDSSMLAIAQSDNVVYVYKIGLEWGDKKSICCRIQTNSSVTCICWPSKYPNDFIFGLADGSVKSGKIQKNKSVNLYNTESYVVSCSCGSDGSSAVIGHLDGSIYSFHFGDESGSRSSTYSKIAVHPCPPVAIAWGRSICASGNDCQIAFYNPEDGSMQKSFDVSKEMSGKELEVAAVNPDGDILVLGGFNRFALYTPLQRFIPCSLTFSSSSFMWELSLVYGIQNFLTLTAAAWRPDGSRLCLGNINGAVEMFEVSQRKCLLDKFELNFVSPSRLIVKDTESGERTLVHSRHGHSISKVNIYRERYLAAHTSDTLILADLQSKKFSEIRWKTSDKEKFSFENESICIAYNLGELHVVEYGRDEVIGSYRTEYMNSHLARNSERPAVKNGVKVDSNRKIAYLLDMQTIRVVDLDTNGTLATINHDNRIDFVELNSRCTYLVFRDTKRQLHLFNLETQNRSTLLPFSSYVQWVPLSDVLVAQSRNNLCIWYSITSPETITQIPIKGEVEEIVRENGKTEVIVNEGNNYVSYALNEGLIGFGIAIEDGNLSAAVQVLERLEDSQETDNMWKQLLGSAYEQDNFVIAERCAAGMGDMARARFLHKNNKLAQSLGKDDFGRDHWMVTARKYLYQGQYDLAEQVLIDHGKVEEAIKMYQVLHRDEDAIRIAVRNHYEDAMEMKSNYYKHLIDSEQEDKAAKIKEEEGEFKVAIDLYLRGGLPGMAANIATKNPSACNEETKERISQSLLKSGQFERAGAFFEHQNKFDRAMSAYIQGNAFQNAVDLCRSIKPGQVVKLEEQWGDYLVSQQNMDAAINHFIEANCSLKAIQAAIDSRQWKKAVQMVSETLSPSEAAHYYKLIGDHYRDTSDLALASKYYVKAGRVEDAIEMYNSAKNWQEAERLASEYLSPEDLKKITVEQAKRLESMNNFVEAEKLFLRAKETELAFRMYRKVRNYKDLIRLVNQYAPERSAPIHIDIAHELEAEGNLKESEHHYLEAGDWRGAVNMYIQNNQWEQAIRVAKYNGGNEEGGKVAYQWARTLGGQAGANLLRKNGLISESIDYAIENTFFDYAFEVARSNAKEKVNYVHVKYANFLEKESRIDDAEKEYIAGQNSQMAIEMRIDRQEWDSAIRIASEYDPPSITKVFLAQGAECQKRNDCMQAEDLYMRGNRPDLAINMYMAMSSFEDALRIAKDYAPQRIKEITHSKMGGDERGGEKAARMYEEAGEYDRAIDCYMKITVAEAGNEERACALWKQGVTLCSKFSRQRYPMLVDTAAQKFTSIRKYDVAGDLLSDVGRFEESLDCYITGRVWKKAEDLATKRLPQTLERVRKERREYLSSIGSTDQLLRDGEVDTALDVFITQGEWDKVFRMTQSNPTQRAVYSMQYASLMVKEQQFDKAAQGMAKYGLTSDMNAISICRQVAEGVLAKTQKEEAESPTAYEETRAFVRALLQLLRSAKPQNAVIIREFDLLLLVVHYCVIRERARAKDMKEIVKKLSISLLRFCDIIPADKAFHQAATACRDIGDLNMAFVFMSRFLDISEAIEDANLDIIGNADFIGTDIPAPYSALYLTPRSEDFGLPNRHYLDPSELESIRNWVLSLSLESKLVPGLQMVSCKDCGDSIFEGDLQCKECNSLGQPCVVTGYVIHNLTTCKVCKSKADEESWNTYVSVFKQCPWCEEAQGITYSRMGGSGNSPDKNRKGK